MFQNDKNAIYEFIFIDHIVFIFMEGRKKLEALAMEIYINFLRFTSLDVLKDR